MPTKFACAVPGCAKPAKFRGICNAHYQRQSKGIEVDTIRPYTLPSRTAPGGGKPAAAQPTAARPEQPATKPATATERPTPFQGNPGISLTAQNIIDAFLVCGIAFSHMPYAMHGIAELIRIDGTLIAIDNNGNPSRAKVEVL